MTKSMEIQITVGNKTVKTTLANLKKFSRTLQRANRAYLKNMKAMVNANRANHTYLKSRKE